MIMAILLLCIIWGLLVFAHDMIFMLLHNYFVQTILVILIIVFRNEIKSFLEPLFNKIRRKIKIKKEKPQKRNSYNKNCEESNLNADSNQIPVFEREHKAKSQFVEETKRQIESKTRLNIFWPKGTNESIYNKEDFVAYIDNAYKKTPFTVHMNKLGVYKVSFPTGFRKDVLFNQIKKKNSNSKFKKENIDSKNGEIDLKNLPDHLEINEAGKIVKKPDYANIAKEWFNNNYKLINSLARDAELQKDGLSKFKIESNKLPGNKSIWKEIALILKNQLPSCSYYLNKNNLTVKFKKEV